MLVPEATIYLTTELYQIGYPEVFTGLLAFYHNIIMIITFQKILHFQAEKRVQQPYEESVVLSDSGSG